ncbi:MAG TPA: glycoside hydrolase family 27 protein [Acidobacteriaceae bacterium]|jgi:alpha-galactosidase|nr:glycoside hydrolase family 27 protein [Acidobacteriaceae bacterium]
MRKTALVLALFALPFAATAQTKIAATPAMGWNSWNHFATHVTDKDVRDAADTIVSSGMKDAGYIYVNIDDAWEGKRDASGNIVPNGKFPDMKSLADYVHSKGLKIGIYSSPGPQTCGKYEGSYQHEEQDAKMYAQWGIDYLKYDLCSYHEIMQKEAPGDQAKQYAMMHAAYEKMHKALQATGRPIYFSLCQYGWDSVWKWGPTVGGNSWRTTDDIEDNYMSMSNIGFSQAGLSKYAAPGHWNDPDMLEVGNGKMKYNEYLTHMSLWAILAAPLLAGNDLSQMSAETKSILMNKDVIAIDQDPLGKQGDRVSAEGPFEVWSKPLKDGSIAVGLFNRGHDAEQMSLPLAKLGLSAGSKIHNVWNPSDSGHGPWMIPEHGVVLLIIKK